MKGFIEMKSVLHEASTIMKAIEKAWEESGQPIEFNVKVLESGEKGFLWFAKHPAIVSLTFDPKKQGKKSRPSKNDKKVSQKQRPKKQSNQKQKSDLRGKNDQRNNRKDAPRKKSPNKDVSKERKTSTEPQVWNDQWIDEINTWLKELTDIMGITTKFTSNVEKRTLIITFNERLLGSADDEKLLFISLSYTLIQFLKKKHKKKFRGFHLLITSKGMPVHEKQQSKSSN